jgi:hypothetical protein
MQTWRSLHMTAKEINSRSRSQQVYIPHTAQKQSRKLNVETVSNWKTGNDDKRFKEYHILQRSQVFSEI